MWPVSDAVGFLKLTNIAYDQADLLVRNFRQRGHIAKSPVMLLDTPPRGGEKRGISMMTGIINIVYEWGAFVGPSGVNPMARRASCFEYLSAPCREGSKYGHLDRDSGTAAGSGHKFPCDHRQPTGKDNHNRKCRKSFLQSH